ncbi:MAG TPA: carboxypeptidase-like regulatory domain-containing protein [Verrucomicrobiae bacterium]|nr:carboxypeptidase-like regulatory domain-containing protein [Verrucomicrobiae bacterium]
MRVRQVVSVFLIATLFCLGGVLTAWAQSTNTGTVVGTVTDASGAVVPGVSVTLSELGTSSTRTATTNDAGHYLFANIDPGLYSISLSKQGFATTKSQAEVKVGQSTTLNFSLQVGTSTTTVEVQATGTELQTMNATVGNTITSVAIDNLPSLGRDVSTFVTLQPGVSPDGSVAGAVVDESYFSLDGGNNTNDMDGSMSVYTTSYAGDPTGGVANQSFGVAAGATGVLPTPQDSVEEFKVNTAGQTADFNSSAGAEVKVVTKRGHDAWHGTAYEYYRDNNWSSNSWDANYFNALYGPGTAGLPAFHYSRFGAAVGGPLIPKELLGGKTYVFFNYEGFRFPNSELINRDVPSPSLELGLLTDTQTNTVYNLNPTPVTYNGVTYPGTTIDPRGIGLNPTVQQLWSQYEPTSNAACVNSLCDGANVLGFTGNVSVPQSSKFAVTRIDHDFGSKWHFMSSWRYYNLKHATTDQIDIGGFFSGDTLGTPASQSGDPQQAWYYVAGLTTNITPNITNDIHYSFLRNWWSWSRAGDTVQITGLGGALEVYSGESASQNLAPYNVNTQQTRTRFWDGHDQMIRDDVSMLHGNHLFQLGGTYQHNFNWHQRTDNGGGINYQPVYQLGQGSHGAGDVNIPFCQTVSTEYATTCGADYAAALGIVSAAQVAYTRYGPNLTLNTTPTPAFDQSTIPYYNFYFSDTWHMKPSFTLTYGLGWTLEMPPVEANGKQVELVDQNDEPISAEDYLSARKRNALLGQVFNPEVGFALVGNTANGLKYPYHPFYGSFSPRIAAAWNPKFDSDSMAGKLFGHDDTVIRGGYGRIYGRLNGVDLVLVPLLGTGLIQPVQCFDNIMDGTCGSTGSATAANAFRIGIDGNNAPIPLPSTTLVQPDYPGYNAIAAGAGESLDPNFRPNVVDSFDFTIQRQLSRKLTLELGYIGRRITHEYQPININAVPYMMTQGGQRFDQAYANVVMQYCGGLAAMGGGNCAGSAGAVTAQPFFETALAGTGYCTGYTSCTAAVVANEGAGGTGNLTFSNVWSLWSDLDNGGFNFPRTMMNTPVPGSTFGGSGQLTSGVAVNASVGYGNYNAGFATLRMNEWKGLTMQSNFTWSKALGTGALVQATSEYTPDDPYNLAEMYGRQSYDRKFVYTAFLVYSPPFYKGQSGLMGRVLGGWTFASVFAAGSGQPIEVSTTNGDGQAFGGADAASFFDNENAIPIGPITSGHRYSTHGSNGVGTGGLPLNIFKDPEAAFNNYRNPILGVDTRDGGFGQLTGLAYWNMDFTVKKNIRIAESVDFELQGVFANILNHDQLLDPQGMAMYSPGTFGNLLGSAQAPPAGGNRAIELGARVRF